jgi:hypothetical protein
MYVYMHVHMHVVFSLMVIGIDNLTVAFYSGASSAKLFSLLLTACSYDF